MDFFRPWHRRIGAAMLLLSALVTGFWLRSRSNVDQLYYLVGTHQLHVFYSCPQGIAWTRIEKVNGGPILGTSRIGKLSIESMDVTFSNLIYPAPIWDETEFWPKWLGLRVVTVFAEVPGNLEELSFWIVPHWMFAGPLTLLSACLLLLKPRQSLSRRSPSRSVEPIEPSA